MNETTITNKQTLALVAEFADEDTRTITLDNPKADITTADLTAAENAMSILIGDKQSSRFSRLKSATRKNTTTTTILFS